VENKSVANIFGLRDESKFDSVSISLASPETIRSWSRGEVKEPETINYRTFKPEKGGLFCERIFGPTKDWECSCGKYKRIKHKGVICDRCGVEVTVSRVRRERMGHIELAVPVSHIWFYKCLPSRMGLILDMKMRDLERVLYYEDYIVVDPGETVLEEKQLLSDEDYNENLNTYGDRFIAKMGAEAIRDLLAALDLDDELERMQIEVKETRSKQKKTKLVKRMKVLEGMRESGCRPEWMVLEVLPVIPPDLRPLVPLEGGRFATSDLNDLYRRVINRNTRLRNLLQLKTPDVIIRNEKRMLQEAVDALLDNGRHGRAATGSANRQLKSLSDMLKGKQGRFRQNLLGKRVDYSGRSVIVIGPDLSIRECGLPKKMALELFEPFIIKRLKERNVVHTVRSAKKLIEQESDEVWDILEEVTKGHTVMLNRAPTLHRLSVQSFEPRLIEGEAIQLHPLVCTAYNADFDGDQMAVHVPLSVEAQLESKLLMLAPNNIFSPSSGKPIMTPTQDIALGCYFLTVESEHDRRQARKIVKGADGRIEHLPIMENAEEVHTAYDEGVIALHDKVRLKNPDCGRETIAGDSENRVIVTTVGRVFFNEIWPEALGFANRTMKKKDLSKRIMDCYQVAGHDRTIQALDDLKRLGFDYATISGISIGMVDLIIPGEKEKILDQHRSEIAEVEKQYSKGIITNGERYNTIIDKWTHANEEIAEAMFKAIEMNEGYDAHLEQELHNDDINPVYVMVDSGARGSKQQIRQLSGIRGLMAKPSGDIIERPILSNFREGLGVLEYFISTHGARKGLADTALKTADSGYLTRKLVDVAHDVIVIEEDCGTPNGIVVGAIERGDEVLVPLGDRILGRTASEDILDPHTKEVIVADGSEIDESSVRKIERSGIERVKIRSVLTCESRRGVCAKCYGRNLATGGNISLGDAVGIIAAQSIGEPGTQLTMRTFHIGGTASSTFKQPQLVAKHEGFVRYGELLKTVEKKDGNSVVLNKNESIMVCDADGRELENYSPPVGSIISVPDGGKVAKGATFAIWDPYNTPIMSEHAGVIDFFDFTPGVTIRNEVNEATGHEEMVVMDHKGDLHPQIVLKDTKSGKVVAYYTIPAGAHVVVSKGDEVPAGEILAKTPRKSTKTKDITGGLPRVAELFEARHPKDAAEIARIDGIVRFAGTAKGKRRLIVLPEGEQDLDSGEEHLIPMNKHVVVFDGDRVEKAQQLTEGPVLPQEILDIRGPKELQEYLLNEVQEVYRLQGVEINDKHIEIIVRQMLRKVQITEPGDTDFLWNEQVEKHAFSETNEKVMADGGKPAKGAPILLGITKAALGTESFISAASFQDTTRVLTDAATRGRRDNLRGFKENVIMGHLIPAGTGFNMYKNSTPVKLGKPISAEEMLGGDII
jgi:DNA-directed RNA polymerase subunit beta'